MWCTKYQVVDTTMIYIIFYITMSIYNNSTTNTNTSPHK